MNAELTRKLASLRADYDHLVGRPFANFYCPILFRDEPVPLSLAHVVNEAFTGSDKRTTVQRADVDSFFGSRFEADFVLLHGRGSRSAVDVLLDSALARQFRPQLLVDGQPVAHYLPKGSVPKEFSELTVERDFQPPMRLVLKLEPSEMLTALDGTWEITMDKDIRMAALVSLLKAAHLTLFSMMGYSYGLTASGHFLGWEVLGKFALANMHLDRPIALTNATAHFPEFMNLVRPMPKAPEGIRGTISDRQLFLCTGTPKAWAFMVFVRTGEDMHAVIVPLLEDAEGAARFAAFLKTPAPRFEVRRALFREDHWDVATVGHMISWPDANFS